MLDERTDTRRDFLKARRPESAAGDAGSRPHPDGASKTLKPILVVLHQETSTPGRVGLMLRERGYELDIRKPRFGDPLPATLEHHSAAVIFGGPMSSNDPDDFVKQEIDWISVPLAEKKPFLGICLGAQMLSRHVGGTVGDHPEGIAEIGYYPLSATASGRGLLDWPETVYQWHREWMRPPPGADVLAVGPGGEAQAFRAGPRAFGFQFHSELTLAMMHRWTVRGAERLTLKGAQSRAEHMHGRMLHDPATRDWLNRFLDLWLNS